MGSLLPPKALRLSGRRFQPVDGDTRFARRPAQTGGTLLANWWTRTQRIRTAAEIPFEASLLEIAELPLYQPIAPKAIRLWELGLSLACIARHLGVTDNTVAKALST
jgi:hypothetical protein